MQRYIQYMHDTCSLQDGDKKSALQLFAIKEMISVWSKSVPPRDTFQVPQLEDSGYLAKLNEFYMMMVLNAKKTSWEVLYISIFISLSKFC